MILVCLLLLLMWNPVYAAIDSIPASNDTDSIVQGADNGRPVVDTFDRAAAYESMKASINEKKSFVAQHDLGSVDDNLIQIFKAQQGGGGRKLYTRQNLVESLHIPTGTLLSQDGIHVTVEIVPKECPNEEDWKTTLLAHPGVIQITGSSQCTCSVNIDIRLLDRIAAHPNIKSVTSNVVNLQASGLVSSFASPSMFADQARDLFGVTGQGLLVCTLSDSFDCVQQINSTASDDIRDGDLPPWDRLTIVRDVEETDGIEFFKCTDEGRAMMQLIHDVAPGVNQAFHTAEFGKAAYADAIRTLVQDDLVAQAVDYAVSKGVPYFSAAGNFNRQSWTGPWVQAAGTFLNQPSLSFGQSIFSLEETTVLSFLTSDPDLIIILQWDDPTSFATGLPGPRTNLDLFVFDGTTSLLVESSSSDNALTGEPVEFVSLPNPGFYQMEVTLTEGPPPGFVKIIFSQSINLVLGDLPQEIISASTSYGHANAEGAIAVGAADYRQTPGFGVSPATINSFSAAGGTPIFFGLDGLRLPKEQTRMTPSVVGPDGTCTNFFPPFSEDVLIPGCFSFSGTSAATSNVAAVAALMLEAAPFLTPDQVKSILQVTAEDMDSPSTAWYDFGFDFDTGFGFVNARTAVNAARLTNPPTPTPRPTVKSTPRPTPTPTMPTGGMMGKRDGGTGDDNEEEEDNGGGMMMMMMGRGGGGGGAGMMMMFASPSRGAPSPGGSSGRTKSESVGKGSSATSLAAWRAKGGMMRRRR